MVARLLTTSVFHIDFSLHQAAYKTWAQQQEVHPEPGVAPEGFVVDPERVQLLAPMRMQVSSAIRPTLSEQLLIRRKRSINRVLEEKAVS